MKQLLAASFIITAIVLGLSINAYAQESASIPKWVKNTAKFWVNGDVSDADFKKAIQYLVTNKIIKISSTQQNYQSIQPIPSWIKNLVSMWTSGQATDADFTKGVEYLVNIGIITVNVQSSQAVSTPTSAPSMTTSQNPPTTTSDNLPPKILTGVGVNLKIINNMANGSLVLNGKQYNANNLAVSVNADKITITGQIQGGTSVLLQASGTRTTGIQYNFNGNIVSNGNFTPVTFVAFLTNPAVQSTTIIPSKQVTSPAVQSTPTTQAPNLPMLMLTSSSDRVYMGSNYNLVVRVYDPQSNPQKIFDQYHGGIADVSITAIITDSNNKIVSQSSGHTDSKGGYQTGILIPIRPSFQEQVKININATKNGYATQQTSMTFWIVRQNSQRYHILKKPNNQIQPTEIR